jgi:hypothetical protein
MQGIVGKVSNFPTLPPGVSLLFYAVVGVWVETCGRIESRDFLIRGP